MQLRLQSKQAFMRACTHAHVHTHTGKFMLDASLSRYLVLSHTLWISKSCNVAPGEFGSVEILFWAGIRALRWTSSITVRAVSGQRGHPGRAGVPGPTPSQPGGLWSAEVTELPLRLEKAWEHLSLWEVVVSVHYSLSSLRNSREWRDKWSRQGGTWQTARALWSLPASLLSRKKANRRSTGRTRDPGVSDAIGFNKGAGMDWSIKTAPRGSASLPVGILEIDGHSARLTRLSLSIIN